jgi:hypothetical protein
MTVAPSLSPAADTVAPAIVVLSDSDRVFKVIQYLLADDYLLTGMCLNDAAPAIRQGGLALTDPDGIGMVILVAIQPETEPMVLLGQVGLGCLIGQAPILLITERRFHPAPTGVIVGLTYPFTPKALRSAVQALYPRPR